MSEDIYKKLVTLLKLFKNRPYHLAKYLIDNNALGENFIKTVLNSSKLDNISSEDLIINFNSIEQMDEFYSSLVDLNNLENKTTHQIKEELNLKLKNLIDNEKYEEAANLRDYMKRKKIERK
jgi:mannitol-specific phosphotransferase system IIBC component